MTGKPTNGAALNYTLSRVEGQDVNDYTITVTPGSNPNYTVGVEGGSFSITAKAVTIKADDKTKTYDNDATTDPALTATVTGKPEKGAALNYTLSRVEGQDVNDYAITVTPGSNPNYTVSVEGASFSITAKAITIKADDKTKEYDKDASTDPALTATVTGKPEKGVALNYTLSRTEGQDVNDYAITVTLGSNPNYTVSTENGSFHITPAPLTITAKDQSFTYTAAAQGENNATYTNDAKVTVTGLKGDDKLTSVTIDGRETNAGEYAHKLMPSAAEIGTATGNYSISYVGGKLTIKKAPLTITAKDQVYVYSGASHGEKNQTYRKPENIEAKVTVTGLLGSDKLTAITLDGSAANMNVYPGKIVPSNAQIGTATDNYSITYVAGKLTIARPGTATVTTPSPLPSPTPTPTPTPTATAAPVEATPSPTPSPTASPEKIEPDDTPAANVTPETVKDQTKHWSFLDLVLMLGTLLSSLVMLAGVLRSRDGSGTGSKLRLLGLIPAAVGVAMFFLTQDLSGTPTLADKWSVAMAATLLAEGVIAWFTRSKKA